MSLKPLLLLLILGQMVGLTPVWGGDLPEILRSRMGRGNPTKGLAEQMVFRGLVRLPGDRSEGFRFEIARREPLECLRIGPDGSYVQCFDDVVVARGTFLPSEQDGIYLARAQWSPVSYLSRGKWEFLFRVLEGSDTTPRASETLSYRADEN